MTPKARSMMRHMDTAEAKALNCPHCGHSGLLHPSPGGSPFARESMGIGCIASVTEPHPRDPYHRKVRYCGCRALLLADGLWEGGVLIAAPPTTEAPEP